MRYKVNLLYRVRPGEREGREFSADTIIIDRLHLSNGNGEEGGVFRGNSPLSFQKREYKMKNVFFAEIEMTIGGKYDYESI